MEYKLVLGEYVIRLGRRNGRNLILSIDEMQVMSGSTTFVAVRGTRRDRSKIEGETEG
jgi:hypothetical protein